MELPDAGEHCFVKECGQLDFLPIKCAHCSEKFCKNHFSPSSHNCTAVQQVLFSGEDTDQSFILSQNRYPCSYESCSHRDVMEMLCSKCEKHFCVLHRHHGCSNPKKEAQRARREKYEAPKRQFNEAKEAVNKMLDAKIEKNRGLTGAKQETANKIQLMRLKQKATGRRNVPFSSRSYFLVHWKPQGCDELESKAVFVNKEWPLGRVVDNIAEQCKILTDPNPSAPKLRLFHMSGEIVTENMSLPLEKLLVDNILIDGANISVDFALTTTSADQSLEGGD